MDAQRIGQLIKSQRQGKGLTQRQVADQLHISDKTISKWECGAGIPDISLLPALSNLLNIDLASLLQGDLNINPQLGDNMKNTCFYLCPHCQNLIISTDKSAVSCCGERLTAQPAKKAAPGQALTVEVIEDSYYISSDHPMTKDNYIAFLALLTGDSLFLRKLYPEWNLQSRLPKLAHGRLLWYSKAEGLRYQLL
ncbi:helix-turn-helix domain-containing protein [Peptococcus simiae]|uniref:helix-turn-helix domain-containing protein n=1 Tax=Peptococcus simiae TaxID=1643805 RepID=UPI00397F352C